MSGWRWARFSSQSCALLPTGGSLSQSSPSLFWPASGLRLCIQSPQREWSTRPFMCRGMLGSSQCSSPEGLQRSGASRNPGCTPCCCVIPMPWFFKNALLCCGSLDYTATNQTNWWVKCECTENTLYSQETLRLIPRSLIQFMWGVETHLG